MALVITKSAALLAAVASPATAESNSTMIVTLTDTVTVPIGSANDYSVLDIPIPVNANILSVTIANDALGTDTTMNIGLFRGSDGAYADVDDDAFESALAVASAIAPTDYRYTNLAGHTILTPAYSLAGLGSEPSYGNLFLGVLFPAAVTASGIVSAKVTYQIDV